MFHRPVHHMISNKSNETIATSPPEGATESNPIPANAAIHLLNLNNCMIHINSPCTKVLIESCSATTVTLSAKITTQMVEIWKSNDVSLDISGAATVFTLQVDNCVNLPVRFESKDKFESIVWSKSEGINVSFVDVEDTITAGFEASKAQLAPGMEITETDQFIIRFVGDTLASEVIVRVGGGFATTIREDEAYEAKMKRNEDVVFNKYFAKNVAFRKKK